MESAFVHQGEKNIQIKHLFILSKPLVDVIFEYEINKLRTI